MTIPFSAGALYSTTGDLLKWEQALFGGKVLKPESLAKMTTPFKSDYGFGLVIRTVDGHKLITHGGGIEGFNTSLNYYPDDKLTVIVLGNLTGGSSRPDRQLHRQGRPRPIRHPHLRAQGDHSPRRHPLRLRRHLPRIRPRRRPHHRRQWPAASPPNSASRTPSTSSPNLEANFFLKITDAQIEFFRDPATHAVNRLVIHQNGAQHDGKKQ